ncbi:MAG: membrane protein insertion efficiency factor YidD [Elusimicrobiota bacterium]
MRLALAALLKLYQKTLRLFIPPCCRFHPSCSDYAREAVLVHGCWRGLGMTLWRLARCQPLNPGGLDPVPPASYNHG